AYPSRCVSPSVLIPQPPVPTLFPYTTLFRSPDDDYLDVRDAERMAVRPTGTINCDCVTPAGDVSSVTTTSGLAFKVPGRVGDSRSEEHTSELQSRVDIVFRVLLEKNKQTDQK